MNDFVGSAGGARGRAGCGIEQFAHVIFFGISMTIYTVSVKPSAALQRHRTEIRRIVECNSAANPCVFGSVVRGEDTEASDLDILVDAIEGKTTLISLARIQLAIEALTGVRVDVRTPPDLHERFRTEVLIESKAV